MAIATSWLIHVKVGQILQAMTLLVGDISKKLVKTTQYIDW